MEEITLNEEDANTEDSPKLSTEDDNPEEQAKESSINEEEVVAEVSSKQDEEEEKQEEDVLHSLIAKLQTLELKNTEYLNEIENQKKVIELIRAEAESKDKECVAAAEELQNFKKSSEVRYKTLSDETSKKINDLKKAYELANKDKESMVIKYAMGEKDILIARRGKEEAYARSATSRESGEK